MDKDYKNGQKFTFNSYGGVMPVKLVNASILKAAREDMLPNNSYKLPDAVNYGTRKSRLLTNGGIIETEGSHNRRPT